jgi:hypothetical protein
MVNRIIFILFFSVICVYQSGAQQLKQKNLPNFDTKKYHFGFLLSVNTADFYIDYKPDFTFADSLLGLANAPQSGFNLALLASFHFRFIPGLSFQDRGLNFRFKEEDGTTDVILKRTESVYLDFPILVKLRTNRVDNFAAYALIGGKYSRDMQSQKDVNNAIGNEVIIRLKDNDYSLDVGGGVDFFLPFFKLSIEMKTAIGLTNVLIQEESRFSSPIESLRTRTFVFSLCFEG